MGIDNGERKEDGKGKKMNLKHNTQNFQVYWGRNRRMRREGSLPHGLYAKHMRIK